MLGSILRKAAKMFGLQRGDLPDLPPKAFRDLPLPSDYKIVYFDREPELDAWARENNISQGSAYGRRRFWGGVAPAIKTVGLLKPGVMRDPEWDARVYQHEVGGHANGLVHKPGTDADWGYLGPDGRFWPVQTLEDLNAARARYPLSGFDWSKTFPAAQKTTQPTMTGQAPTPPGPGLMTGR